MAELPKGGTLAETMPPNLGLLPAGCRLPSAPGVCFGKRPYLGFWVSSERVTDPKRLWHIVSGLPREREPTGEMRQTDRQISVSNSLWLRAHLFLCIYVHVYIVLYLNIRFSRWI